MTVEVGSEADELVQVTRVLARSLRVRDARLQPTLDKIVAVAAEVSQFEAGLILVDHDRFVPQAVTGEAPHQLDLLQQEQKTGPCLDAARRQQPVRIEDSRVEERWAGFGGHAAALGVLSMLCFPLWVDEQCLGTLSLYADRPAAFDVQDERVAMICATLAAVTLADAHRAEQLREAMHSRDVIGQAKGILMERLKITPDAAFSTLVEVSQRRNRKLIAVAHHLVETGELPGGADPA